MTERETGESSWILDASAVLALLQGEAGGQVVEQRLPGAAICAVNLCEVIGKLFDVGMPGSEVREILDALGLEVVPFHAELAWKAASLRQVGRPAGLSLGDLACLATGLLLNRPILGADRAWKGLDLGVHVDLIR